MDFLYLLEDLRNGVLDTFFLLVTELGSETAFLVIALAIFWCVDKRQGYYLMSVGFLGTLVNQFLKITCRIPRPWVRDYRFTIVEAARPDAEGYSFPSGHSTSSVGTFGVLAAEAKQSWLRYLSLGLCLLVPFSRMYLGVHTPADVLVGAAISLLFLIVLRPIIYGGHLPKLLAGMVAASVGFVAYMEFFPFPAEVDRSNLHAALKNSYTLLGALLGMLVVYAADRKLKFQTEAPWFIQILKVVLGLGLVVALKEGLKLPLEFFFRGHLVERTVRYFAIVLFAGIAWPMTFPQLAKLGRKDGKK